VVTGTVPPSLKYPHASPASVTSVAMVIAAGRRQRGDGAFDLGWETAGAGSLASGASEAGSGASDAKVSPAAGRGVTAKELSLAGACGRAG
jgi:hypothetical protein